MPDGNLLENIRASAHEYLEKTARSLASHGVRIETAMIEQPRVATAILDEATGRGCDLIALATHGYGGLARLVLGSVTDKVVRGAHVAVLAYHTRPSEAKKVTRGGNTMDPNELVTIFSTGDPSLARIVANELEAEGIQSSVSGENQAGFSGILDVDVLVRTWDADRARAIIHEGGHHAKTVPPQSEMANRGTPVAPETHGRQVFRQD